MSESDKETQSIDDSPIETLLSSAELRPVPRSDRREEIFCELRQELRDSNYKRARGRFIGRFGIAAAILAAVFLTLDFGSKSDTGDLLASSALQRVVGENLNINGAAVSQADGLEYIFRPGDTIETGSDTLISVLWHTSGSLRVGASSELDLVGEERVDLRRGNLYFDSKMHDLTSSSKIEVETPLGVIRNVGTQFVVQVANSDLIIGVREGEVKFRGGPHDFTIYQGQSAHIDSSYGIEILPLDGSSKFWGWPAEVAPKFHADGKILLDVIYWIGRETGRKIEFESNAARRLAASHELRGMGDIEHTQAIPILTAATNLYFEVSDRVILVKQNGSE